jgi:type VI secretion system protein ImpF
VAAEAGRGGKIVQSVLDRLLDDDPEQPQERPKPPAQELRELRDSVMRDVADILNTRRRWPPPDPALGELTPSLADYGIPDFTGADLSSTRALEQFRDAMETALRRYEPRFKSVRVEIQSGDDAGDRTLRFRIDALLHADPVPESVVFDSFIDPVTGGFEVEE